jgi:hypothetical protein
MTAMASNAGRSAADSLFDTCATMSAREESSKPAGAGQGQLSSTYFSGGLIASPLAGKLWQERELQRRVRERKRPTKRGRLGRLHL